MPKRRMKRHAVTQPLDPSYRLIALTQGQNAIVDAADFEWLSQWNWYAHWDHSTKSFYAERGIGKRTIQMSRMLLGCKPGEKADHKNHDTLNNRRENIRKATSEQNAHNCGKHGETASGFKGVYWNKRCRKWLSHIQVSGKIIHLGRFVNASDAARAYDAAAKQYHKEFACFNFTKVEPSPRTH